MMEEMDYRKAVVDKMPLSPGGSSGIDVGDDSRTETNSSNSNNEEVARLVELDMDYFSEEERSFDKEYLEVDPGFLSGLLDRYGPQPGADLAQLSRHERKIRVSFETCYEIFRHSNSIVENARFSENQWQRQHQIERQASASSSSSNSSNASRNGSPALSLSLVDQEEEDFQEILRQIAELEEESDRAYALQLEQLEIQGLEEAAVAGFKDIIERDKLKAAHELLKYQEMRKIKWTMAQTIKCSRLKAVFPKLHPKLVEDVFMQKEFNWEQALVALRDVYPSKYEASGGGGETKQGTVKKVSDGIPSSFSGNEWFYDPDAVANLSQTEKTKLLEQATLWRLEADNLGKQYQSARGDAVDHQLIKPAYSLKTMAATGFRFDAHKALEQYWFFTLMGLNAGNKNPNKIDLHCLSVPKAKDIVHKYLQNRKMWVAAHLPKNGTQVLTVITGQGRHSVNNIPRLYPAIRQYLLDNHFSFSEGESAGNFFVRLTNLEDPKPIVPQPSSVPALNKVTVKPRTK